MVSHVGWPERIGLMILIKERLSNLESHVPYGYQAPHLGASEDQLQALEDAIRGPLDQQHRELLSHIDGWPDFYFSTEILSTDQLRNPSDRAEILEYSSLSGKLFDGGSWLLLARAVHDRDTMLIGRPGTQGAGQVVWLAGEVIDTYQDIGEWFSAMVEYHRRALAKFGVVDLAGPSPR